MLSFYRIYKSEVYINNPSEFCCAKITSLYTREALGGRGLCSDTSPRVRVANLLHWGRLGSMYDFPWKVDYRAAPN